MFLIAFAFAAPTIPIFAWDLDNDCPAKLQLDHTQFFHDFRPHCLTNSWYFLLFLSFAKVRCSSYGTKSSPIMQFLALPEYKIRSGLSVVSAICLGNFNCAFKSTINSQSASTDSRLKLRFPCFFPFAPSLMKSIKVSLSLLVGIYYTLTLHWLQSLLLWGLGHDANDTKNPPWLWGNCLECAEEWSVFHITDSWGVQSCLVCINWIDWARRGTVIRSGTSLRWNPPASNLTT